jgi:beta-N-acetylhexosaminidase
MTGSRFFVVGIGGPSLTESERAIFAVRPPGGIILFSRNVESESQLDALVREIRSELPGVLLFVDQEGGAVDRFRALTGGSVSFCGAALRGEARRAGELAGELCARFDIDVDLAPVVDRSVDGAGQLVMKERAVSDDPREISRAASEFLAGLGSFGVSGCLKHFPGLGRGTVDSHLSLPRIPDEKKELEKDLQPFRDLSRIAPAVMISHASVSVSGLPATLDRTVATRLLRREVRFEGISISDDLEMGALSEFGSLPERSAAAFAAGCDLLCICKETAALPEAAGKIESLAFAARVEEAAQRLARFREGVARLRKGKRAVRPLSEIAAEMSFVRLRDGQRS